LVLFVVREEPIVAVVAGDAVVVGAVVAGAVDVAPVVVAL
jgi:hypothetical protein